jgi:DNA (cytosine-5)-methyltransferase 1
MRDVAEWISPEWIVIEQPSGNKTWEQTVKNDLAGIGYQHSRFELSARSCGAPHQRRRVFFVAHAVRERCEAVARFAGSPAAETKSWPAPPRGAWRTAGTGNHRMDARVSDWVDRIKGLGNALMPELSERIGRGIVAALEARP